MAQVVTFGEIMLLWARLVAALCLKHTIEGDVNHVSVAEVKTLMKGDGLGRVQR